MLIISWSARFDVVSIRSFCRPSDLRRVAFVDCSRLRASLYRQEMVERRLGSLESEMRAANHRPSSPTRSSSGMSIVRPPSSSSNRQLSQSFPDSQQPLPYNSYSQPTPKQSEIKSEHRLGNSPPRSPPFFSTPQTSNSMPPPSLPPPQIGSPQMTERFRSMADTLGLTLEQLQETRTSIFDGGREVDMTALTFEGVMTCWEL